MARGEYKKRDDFGIVDATVSIAHDGVATLRLPTNGNMFPGGSATISAPSASGLRSLLKDFESLLDAEEKRVASRREVAP